MQPTRRLTGQVGGRVEILCDRSGIPHVYASSTPDLYFGLGVAMAEDRLWQMDRLRRRALGRQAEILGPAYLASDIAHLTVGIDQIAAREAEALDEATHRVVAALVGGINRQIELMGRDLPPEFHRLEYAPEPFTVRDVVAIARGIWWSLNGRIDRIVAAEAARLLPEAFRSLYLTPEASESRVLQHAAGTDDATGSNNWALHGSRTAGGRPVLCGDPHQPFWVPSSWYEYALHGPQDDAAGAGHPGFPGMWWGSNGAIAWAITNNMASTRDMYVEQADPADPRRYRDGDTWRAFGQRQVSIKVRGAAAHALTVRSTVRGPVVNALVPSLDAAGDPPLSLRWVGMEHMDDIRASIAVSRARDWKAFRAALRDWSVAIFNFVYADARGHIGYQMAGRIPLRGRVVPGFRDANAPADRWQGYIPFDDLPRMYDPPSGYVASANQRIVPDDWKHPIYGAYSQGHRGVRLAQALGGRDAMDAEANIRLQNDVKNCRAERLCPHILRHLGDAEPIFGRALADWDHRYSLTSIAPTLFEAFMALWQREVICRHLPERLLDLTHQQTNLGAMLLEDASIGYFPDGAAPHVTAVARRTLAELRSRLGNDEAGWQWGRIHQAHWHHPIAEAEFDIGPREVDGGSHTLRNTGGELPPHAASSGAEYRIVVDFTTPDSFLAVQNIGNSGVPDSPHYCDQFEPWLRGEYHVVHLRREAVEADHESITVIEPS
jgi:penicillin G amidase